MPQPVRWHPEIDTGLHTIQVLEVAAELSGDTAVRFASLVHDLGKGCTPRDLWPSHVGHEEAGVKLIDGLCQRLRVPNEHRELAMLTARYHGLAHRAAELRPATIVDLFMNTDAFRRPDRFEQFLLACEADARGRGARLRQSDYPQARLLRDAREAAARVQLDPELLASGKGPVIAQQLRAARIEAVRNIDRRQTEV